jgi:tRNA(fMet)-specific endonuclease VapC
MLDTSIAIRIRDAEPEALSRLEATEGPISLSIITWIELESGVARDPASRDNRRQALDDILSTYPVAALTKRDVLAYRAIVEALGFSRPKLLDRIIAAQAIAAEAVLATQNARDFRDIPGLKLEEWSS